MVSFQAPVGNGDLVFDAIGLLILPDYMLLLSFLSIRLLIVRIQVPVFMNIFLVRGLLDWRYASLTYTTHRRKSLILAITNIMRTGTHCMVFAPSTM